MGLKEFFQTVRELFEETRKLDIRLDDDGFSLMEKTSVFTSVQWKDVLQIFAFKEDLFSIDLICLGFRTDDEGGWQSIDEEMEGYESLLGEIERRYGIQSKDWFLKVAVPAFERNFTHLWGTPYDWK